MGLVTTTSRFCYIECDRLNCNRKIYQFHERILRELAVLSGWENKGKAWTCPACAGKSKSRRPRSPESTKNARDRTV